MTTMPGDDRRHPTSTIVVAVLGIAAVLVIAALWQRQHPYSIETAADIDASPTEVWAVLTDLESYPEWNPTLEGLEGELTVGGRLAYGDQTAVVTEIRENSSLRWETRTGVVGVLDGDRSFSLVELDDGSTRFSQREDFRGIAVPFTGATLGEDTAPAFHEMNAALRERVESLRQ
jgi:hypothetical protein